LTVATSLARVEANWATLLSTLTGTAGACSVVAFPQLALRVIAAGPQVVVRVDGVGRLALDAHLTPVVARCDAEVAGRMGLVRVSG